MRGLATERWLECRRELRLRVARHNVNTFAVKYEISCRDTTYLRCFHVNLTAVVEEREAYRSA